jgi:hypothetical protein
MFEVNTAKIKQFILLQNFLQQTSQVYFSGVKTALYVTLLLFFLLTACQNKTSENQRLVVQGKKPVIESRKKLVYTDTLSSEKAEMILTHYLKIKDALVNSDAEKSALMAKITLPYLEQNADTILKLIYSNTKAISLTKNLIKQRTYFYPLSEAVYVVMKNSKSGPLLLYKQYCPMAFDDTGAWWLSKEEEIMNPYFGDEMLRCGMVQEKF